MTTRLLSSFCVMVFISACTGTISDRLGEDPNGGGSPTSSGSTTTSSGGVGGSGQGGGTSTGGPGPTTTGGGGGAGDGGSAGDGGVAPDPCQTTSVDAGPSTMQLLTRSQYLNTVRDLFGSSAEAESALPARHDPTIFGLVQGNVAQVDLENYGKAAEAVAAFAVTTAKLDTTAPCAAIADKRGCARTFIQTFGSRAYRAPVTDAADIDRHLVVYDLGAPTSYAHGIEMLVRAMLQSPRFLYRPEPGTTEKVGPHAVKLTGYEVAARLSYALWDTMPDAKLTAAAASGALATKAGVADQVTWMIADPRGAKAVRRFLEGFVQLAQVDTVVKDTQLFPDWSSATYRQNLRTQAQTFFDDVLTKRQGSLSALFTADRSDGSGKGMLTLPALLSTLASARESSPIYRGKFVREQLLCQELPAPPPNIPNPPDTKPGVSTRDKFKQHEADPACSGCHRLMDPIGFGFEQYDAIGRFRTTDNGAAIDVSGEIVATRDINGAFIGIAELAQKLAVSAEVQECVAKQWFRFFLSRFEQDADRCSMKRVTDLLRASGNDLNTLPALLTGTDAFLYRRPVDEVLP